MKIISYNVNGIRAALRKDFGMATAASPDVLCLQEIKATPEQFDPSVFEELGLSPQLLVSRPKKGVQWGSSIVQTKTQRCCLWHRHRIYGC